ncbi:acyl-CoA dehydrogenase family protein [Nocardiopsis changdeensis]|uniref:acyl-CoA dehydrogenase family protein n=1 Tax=Nocardiopsis changdeensis TaxID=2831969 RepID=UPI003F44D798
MEEKTSAGAGPAWAEEIRAGAGRLRRSGPDERAPLDRTDWKALAGLGVTGLCLPERHGGRGAGALDTAHGLEALSAGCGDTGTAFAVAAHLLAGAVPLRDFGGGTGPLASLLPGVASGDVILANAMTEEGSGSDVGAITTAAVRDGDSYVIDGAKSFVSNAPIAHVVIVYAVTDPGGGPFRTSAFAVPADTAGLSIGPVHHKSGLRSCPSAAVEFRGCRVPASLRIGFEGQGAALFQHAMAWERACLPAVLLGMMDAQVRDAAAHARRLHRFGRPLSDFQAVSHRVVGLHQRTESARLMLQRACAALDGGEDDAVWRASSAKLAVTEAALENSLEALRLYGASGLREGGDPLRSLLDALHGPVFSGTSDIQREIIARGLGL